MSAGQAMLHGPLVDFEYVDILLEPVCPHHGMFRNEGKVMSEGGKSSLVKDGGVLRGLLGLHPNGGGFLIFLGIVNDKALLSQLRVLSCRGWELLVRWRSRPWSACCLLPSAVYKRSACRGCPWQLCDKNTSGLNRNVHTEPHCAECKHTTHVQN